MRARKVAQVIEFNFRAFLFHSCHQRAAENLPPQRVNFEVKFNGGAKRYCARLPSGCIRLRFAFERANALVLPRGDVGDSLKGFFKSFIALVAMVEPLVGILRELN